MTVDAVSANERAVNELDQLVTHLFDAVRYSEQMVELENQAEEMEGQSDTRISALNGVAKEIAASLEKLTQKVDSESATQLYHQVMEFVDAAVEQAKAREKDSAAKNLSEVDAKVEIQRTKALKSLESYLVGSPIPAKDVVLTVSLKDTGYTADASYNCQGNISYRFSLSTQNSRFFHSGFAFAAMGRKLPLPVEVQRTWIRKEPSPRFERLDKYVLASAEVSDRHIVAEFVNQETGARVRTASASTDGEGTPTVEYIEDGATTNISTDAALNKFLDTKGLAAAVRVLQSEILSLEQNKAALVELKTDGRDTLASLEVGDLLRAVMKIEGPGFRTLVASMSRKPVKTRTGELSLSVIRERLALLGASAAVAQEGLGLRR